jgi:hypothetical protein
MDTERHLLDLKQRPEDEFVWRRQLAAIALPPLKLLFVLQENGILLPGYPHLFVVGWCTCVCRRVLAHCKSAAAFLGRAMAQLRSHGRVRVE